MKKLVSLLVAVALAVALSTGCEVLVGSGLPAFACTPGDPAACPSSGVCSPAGVCVASCPGTPCENGTVCNQQTHYCVPIGALDGGLDATATDAPVIVDGTVVEGSSGDGSGAQGDIGATCVTQTNCKADLLCLSDAVLADAVATTGPICTKPCCKSEECPASFVCYGPGTGGSYCVKAAVLSRGALLGTAPGGTTCARGAECRSGVCLGSAGNMVCADACCTHTDCAGSNTVCRRTLVDAHNVFACGVPAAGAGASDDPCSGPGACQSGVCIAAGFQGECKPRCCGRQSCAQQTPSYSTCAYVQTAGAPEYLGVCLHSGENPTGSKDLGAACTNDDECQTAFCDPVAKRCTDVCCVDNDCAAYPGTKCRPSSNPHFLTCQ